MQQRTFFIFILIMGEQRRSERSLKNQYDKWCRQRSQSTLLGFLIRAATITSFKQLHVKQSTSFKHLLVTKSQCSFEFG